MEYATYSRIRVLMVAGLLLGHCVMLAWIGLVHAPVFDEIAHLPSGISHWSLGSFDLYRVNPPLPRMIAALGVMMASPDLSWSEDTSDLYGRPEFAEGRRFTERNGRRTPWLFTIGRWTCIVFSLIGGWICYCWARDLFGFGSGVIALTLWCFCPNVLAWGGMIMPDVAGASFGVAASYCFWRWLGRPTWRMAVVAGVVLALAELSKSTWIILFVLWPCLWFSNRGIVAARVSPSFRSEVAHLATMVCIAIYGINLGYGFERCFRPLQDFEFTSVALGGRLTPRLPGNRFRDSLLGKMPVPLPANYVKGLDIQKYEFELGKWSYLNGEHKLGGWYHYYLYALTIKTPLGTLALGLVAISLWVASRRHRLPWRDELSLLVPALAVLLLVSSQTGFNRYVRYVLPALPFLFIAVSRVGKSLDRETPVMATLIVVLLITTVVGSMRVFPHSMSYFNAIVGGPLKGPAHLLDANVDWGQDLLYLKQWIENHPSARPFHLQYFGFLAPEVVGVHAQPVPRGPSNNRSVSDVQATGPQPGWYAVSVNDVFGYRHYNYQRDEYLYFQKFVPIDMLGYSIYIYHLSIDDANRVRRELGLPQLPQIDNRQ
jgi:Dolichyl-phosphate-mannose-protein mannosyltransferase